MLRSAIIASILALLSLSSHAADPLPPFKYSRQPAVLIGCIIPDSTQKIVDIDVQYAMKYSSLTGDALRIFSEDLNDDGCFTMSLPTMTTMYCRVMIGDYKFPCYVIPGDTVSFTFDPAKARSEGLAAAFTFDGALSTFNHDMVYAYEHGFDPQVAYQRMETKRNMNQLADDLPSRSEEGYFSYLDSIRSDIDAKIDADTVIGDAYREFAKAVNRYEYGDMFTWCAQSVGGYDDLGIETDEDYYAYADRIRQRTELYMQDDPWSAPVLSYAMSGIPDFFISHHVNLPVKLPEDYQQCNLASRFLMQMGQESQLLSEAQIDSVRTFLPVLGEDVLDYNDKLEQKLAFNNDQGRSRVCNLPDPLPDSTDVLSALLAPYRGRPVLIDLWETTCGHCRVAFKDMHELKIQLADRVHFLNIASEHSDLATWERLIPAYIGDHYRLTEPQLFALHRQLQCSTALPTYVVVDADGNIHHSFTGFGDIDMIMEHLNPVLQ
ncbi:MAG: TlpA family protein disulfide reductase [Muribaculaceae bacterium]|nr:TlpA family protein disulfide reductase [Muribaculaceae bacterium]